MNNNLIKFDGAGHEKADSSGNVGNCRIRGIINTLYGEAYIEMSSCELTKHSSPLLQKQYGVGNLVGFLTDFFLLKDERTNNSKELYPFFERRGYKPTFVWEKTKLVDFLNSLPLPTDNKVQDIFVDNKWHLFTDEKWLNATKGATL